MLNAPKYRRKFVIKLQIEIPQKVLHEVQVKFFLEITLIFLENLAEAIGFRLIQILKEYYIFLVT